MFDDFKTKFDQETFFMVYIEANIISFYSVIKKQFYGLHSFMYLCAAVI